MRTLYLQVANPDGASPDQLTDELQLREILTRARTRRAEGGGVVPARRSPTSRSTRGCCKTIVAFRSGTARFDTVALDLEYTQGEPDVAVRNDNTVEVAARTRGSCSARSARSARSCIPRCRPR